MIERLSGTMERERYLVEEPEPISESPINEFSKSRIPTPSRSSSTETKVPPRTSVKPTPTEVLTMLRGLQILQKTIPIFSMVNMSALEESDAGAIEKLHELHLALADTFGSPNNNAPLKPPNSRLRRAPSATLNSVRRVWNRPGKLPQRTWSSFRDRAKRMNSKRREPEQITRENTLSTLVESNAEDD
ncbi:hypothetical protein DL96DRAFT_1586910 [Flagelloscypha sp. PMI_526]|nr:hypothetical protein DL96DRAFT_1586910 [Flagelloscypha sp. PMI_526]